MADPLETRATIVVTFDWPVGMGASGDSHNAYKVLIRLRKPGATREGFLVKTAYPVR